MSMVLIKWCFNDEPLFKFDFIRSTRERAISKLLKPFDNTFSDEPLFFFTINFEMFQKKLYDVLCVLIWVKYNNIFQFICLL